MPRRPLSPRSLAPRRRRLRFEWLEARRLLAAFTPGNILVSNSGSPPKPYEYTVAGQRVQEIDIPNLDGVGLGPVHRPSTIREPSPASALHAAGQPEPATDETTPFATSSRADWERSIDACFAEEFEIHRDHLRQDSDQ